MYNKLLYISVLKPYKICHYYDCGGCGGQIPNFYILVNFQSPLPLKIPENATDMNLQALIITNRVNEKKSRYSINKTIFPLSLLFYL
jgi:hypothetical protein